MHFKLASGGFVALICFQLAVGGPPVNFGMHQSFAEQGETQSSQAQRLWEQAIAAKGGREALNRVRNLVISVHGDYASRRRKKGQIRQEGLFVLPDKLWSWTDYRPDVFGLRIEMYDFGRGTKYVISDGEPNKQLEPINEVDKKNRDVLLSLLTYLPETKWLRPIPVEAKAGRIGGQNVDIVQTTFRGARVDFALDPNTHLPIRISYYSTGKYKTYVTDIDLGDYVEVGGIKLPQIVKFVDGVHNRTKYQLNVEYNQDIFNKPPHIDAGPEAWKHR